MSHQVFMNDLMYGVYKDESRFRTVVGGRRIGKTEVLLAEAARGLTKPKSTTWLIEPTLKMARAVFWPRIKQVLPQSTIAKINESDHLITMRNNAQFRIHGAENPNALRGEAVDLMLLDEGDYIPDARDLFARVLYPTLMTTKGKVVTVGSPNGFGLLYDFWIRGGGESGIFEPGWKSWLFKTKDFLKPAGHLDPEEYELARQNMDERSFKQEWEATFLQATGRVTYGWTRNNCQAIEYDPKEDVYVSLDFNVTPAAAVLTHVNKATETIYQFGEIFMADAWTELLVQEISKRLSGHQAHIYVYGDPAGHKRHTTSKQTDWQIVENTFRAAFGSRVHMRSQKEQIPERAKINALNARICNAAGERRYFANPTRCKQTVLDMEQCRALPDGSVDKADKERTHWLDCAGYLAHGLYPILGRSAFRNVTFNV